MIKKIFATGIILLFIFVNCENDNLKKGNDCFNIGDFENAAYFYKKAIKDKPMSFSARSGLGMAQFQLCAEAEAAGKKQNFNKWNTVIKNLEFANRIKSTNDLKKQLAYAYYKAAKAREKDIGDMEYVLSLVLKGLAYKHDDVIMLNYAGIISHKLGKDSYAKDMLLQAIAVDSTDATAYFNLGMIDWLKKDDVGAYMFWAKAMSITPEDETIKYWFEKAEKSIEK